MDRHGLAKVAMEWSNGRNVHSICHEADTFSLRLDRFDCGHVYVVRSPKLVG